MVVDKPIRIELFGELRIHVGEQVITRFRTHRAASLLAFLAAHPERNHAREELAELLWPDCDIESGRNRLKQELATIRRDIGVGAEDAGGPIISDRQTVRLNLESTVTDVGEFRALLKAAAQTPTEEERCWTLVQAIDLYKGDLLGGRTDEWILSEREELRQAYCDAILAAVAWFDKTGDLASASAYAHRAVKADALREEAWCHLMEISLAQGRPAEAIRHYRELDARLRDELGVEPGDHARDLLARCSAVRTEEVNTSNGAPGRPATGTAATRIVGAGDASKPRRDERPPLPRSPRFRLALTGATIAFAFVAGFLVPRSRGSSPAGSYLGTPTESIPTPPTRVDWKPPYTPPPVAVPKARIVFASNLGGDPIKGPVKLWAINTDGTGLRRITSGDSWESISHPSPGRKSIALYREPDHRVPGHNQICTMKPDGSEMKVLAEGEVIWPSWTPDGKHILYENGKDGNQQIYLMNRDGSHPMRVSASAQWADFCPECSPDGRQILFGSNREGGNAIYVMDMDGSHVQRITPVDWGVSSGQWSPDGQRIAFSSDMRGGDPQVFTCRPDGSNVIQLTHSRSAEPRWSPDGEWIVYAAGGGGSNLFIMRADGSQQTRLVHTPGTIRFPAWLTPMPGMHQSAR
jgi:DNA-binding SARP family transcriptional activator